MHLPIVALTSLSPDPAQHARQRKCVASWHTAGCARVIAFQSAIEIVHLQQMGVGESGEVEFVEVAPSAEWGGKLIPISRLTTWAAQHPDVGRVLLINGDIEVECDAATLQGLAREAGDGLLYMHRWESDGRPFIGGADAFLFRAANAHVVPRSEALVFGRPHWDYVPQLAFARAGLSVRCPVARVIAHETHPCTSASTPDWQRTCAETGRLFGRPITLTDVIRATRYLGGASGRARTEAELAQLFGLPPPPAVPAPPPESPWGAPWQ